MQRANYVLNQLVFENVQDLSKQYLIKVAYLLNYLFYQNKWWLKVFLQEKNYQILPVYNLYLKNLLQNYLLYYHLQIWSVILKLDLRQMHQQFQIQVFEL